MRISRDRSRVPFHSRKLFRGLANLPIHLSKSELAPLYERPRKCKARIRAENIFETCFLRKKNVDCGWTATSGQRSRGSELTGPYSLVCEFNVSVSAKRVANRRRQPAYFEKSLRQRYIHESC
jgi:hypothetical protein